MSDWLEYAQSLHAPVFPIRIHWDAAKKKWIKHPLTLHGHLDASRDVSRFNWAGANGAGVAMGAGIYALDLDGYKEGCAAQQWLTQWQVPTQTRVHRTVSGGLHMLYCLPPEWAGLGSRQAVVLGLDSRGRGGWIAFGERYTVACHAPPALLPDHVCLELSRAPSRDVTLQPVTPVDANDVLRRLNLAMTFGRPSLRHRWAGGTDGLHDTSASGFDMSVAKLLANAGFTYSEVYWLLTWWPHGKAARDGLTRSVDRELRRCAARATQNHGFMSQKMREVFGYGR